MAGDRLPGRLGWILAGIVVALALGGLAVTGPAVAGDAVAQFEFEQSQRTAEPGETVTLQIRAASDGGYADEGVISYAFVVAVPPEVGEPTTVEPGPWLAQGDGEVNQTVTDAGEGAIRVEHERVGAENGVTGDDVAATVTIAVREDAPAADATVVVADTDAHLRGSDYRMQTFGEEATIVVAGGGEELSPAYEPGSAGDGSVGVVTAEEANRSVEDAGDANGDDDSLPGFGVLAGIGAIVALLGVGVRSEHRRRRAD